MSLVQLSWSFCSVGVVFSAPLSPCRFSPNHTVFPAQTASFQQAENRLEEAARL